MKRLRRKGKRSNAAEDDWERGDVEKTANISVSLFSSIQRAVLIRANPNKSHTDLADRFTTEASPLLPFVIAA